MLGQHGRGITRAICTPPARLLNKAGVSPNSVTVTGTIVASVAALALLPTGHLVAGPLTIGFIVFADSLDGTMARLAGQESLFGAFLDSTLDRITDGAIFAAFVLYFAFHPSSVSAAGLIAALAATVLGGVVPYARARAEANGYCAAVGIAERSDRLLISLLAALLVGLGLPEWILVGALAYLALAAAITVGQRIWAVRTQIAAAR